MLMLCVGHQLRQNVRSWRFVLRRELVATCMIPSPSTSPSPGYRPHLLCCLQASDLVQLRSKIDDVETELKDLKAELKDLMAEIKTTDDPDTKKTKTEWKFILQKRLLGLEDDLRVLTKKLEAGIQFIPSLTTPPVS
jgi:hypothetical protein